MKRILALIFAFASLTAAAQYVPGQKNYGNYNIYGSQWLNGDLKLQKCIRSKSDTLIIFTTAAGVVDTVNWRYLSNLVGGVGYLTLTDSVLYPTDTTNAVAIGTNSAPAGTMLRVNDGSVLFEGSTGTTPVSGAGTRMMWIPSKAAFRAGNPIGGATWWDDANIGVRSVVLGNGYAAGSDAIAIGGGLAYSTNNIAIGVAIANSYQGLAIGYSCAATGAGGNFAGGYYSSSTGIYSATLGYYTVSSGESSFSTGIKSLAYGARSTAIGDSSRAIGKASFAGGRGKAYGAYSFAWGDSSNAQAAYSAVFGYGNVLQGNKTSWVTTDDLFVVGNGYSAKNNALTILKNGTTYIGDASSTTDPIMTVSTTDSTTTLIGILKLTPQDDPPVSASEGMIYADTDHHLYYYNGTAWVQLD